MLVLTLIGGLALAIYTSVVVLRLQNEVRAKLEENIEAKTSLRELSAKLVRAQEEEREGSRGSCTTKQASPSRRFYSKRKICSTLNTLRRRGCTFGIDSRFGATWFSGG